jgi:hypothetical protein
VTNSYKKRPFAPLCGRSQKDDKRVCNRIQRRTNKVALAQDGDGADFIAKEEALDEWSMAQDGTRRYYPFNGKHPYRLWYKWAKGK